MERIKVEELDMQAAIKTFATGTHIESCEHAGHRNRYLGDGGSISFYPGEKWRIVKPAPPREYTFAQASQIPGKWQLVGHDGYTMDVRKGPLTMFAYRDSQERQPLIGIRFSPDASYTWIGECDE